MKGSALWATDAAISGMAGDKDPAGTVFSVLQLKSKSQGKKNIKLSWKKAAGALRYAVYGNRCGSKKPMQFLAFTNKTSMNVKKAAGSALKPGTYYKFMVVALNGDDEVISASKIVHAATKGGTVTNAKKII